MASRLSTSVTISSNPDSSSARRTVYGGLTRTIRRPASTARAWAAAITPMPLESRKLRPLRSITSKAGAPSSTFSNSATTRSATWRSRSPRTVTIARSPSTRDSRSKFSTSRACQTRPALSIDRRRGRQTRVNVLFRSARLRRNGAQARRGGLFARATRIRRHVRRPRRETRGAEECDQGVGRVHRVERAPDRRLQRVFQRGPETDDRDPCPRRLRVSRVPHGHRRPRVWTVRGPGHAVVDLYLRRAEREGAQAAA